MCSNKHSKKKDVIILIAVMILNRFIEVMTLNRFIIIKCSSSGGGFCNFFFNFANDCFLMSTGIFGPLRCYVAFFAWQLQDLQ